jgi:thioredoxin-dependent peroxiredoxin
MINIKLLFCTFLCILPACSYINNPQQKKVHMVTIGQKAPDFILPDENNNLRSLSDYYGKKVVLYFYPKDSTPGCTKEACAFRDAYQEYRDNNIIIIGISYDSPESHKEFKVKYHLPFTLLSDHKREVAKKYGAYNNIFNYFAPDRKTFLIDEHGTIINIFNNVDVAIHAQEILPYFK